MFRKCVVAIMGGTVLLIGIIMIVTPGPAIVVIPAGLAILATEFAWAKHIKRSWKRSGRICGGAKRLLNRTGALAVE